MNKTIRNFGLFCIICLLLTVFHYSIFSYILVKPEQIFYHLTTLIQVMVTIFSVTVAGTIYYLGLLDNQIKEDDTLIGLNDNIKIELKKSLITIGVTITISILSCFYSISLTNTNWKYYDYIFNLSSILSFSQIFTNVSFILMLLDPKAIEHSANKILQQNQDNNDQKKGVTLVKFLEQFNNLEKLLSEMVIKLDIPHNNYRNQNLIPISQSIKLLLAHNDESIIRYNSVLKEIIYYRNALVHGTEFTKNHNGNEIINEYIYDELKSIIREMSQL